MAPTGPGGIILAVRVSEEVYASPGERPQGPTKPRGRGNPRCAGIFECKAIPGT
ncbi:UNVERIFIED_CONTAM: hypothetical protein Slati_2362800 [Sesamum latifolium]|uniref:Uncharacterized protein n=1 Tax=Sesamum latifolium TaxID=2727402 RepID=A0AAW2WBH0_9LAMI